MKKYHLLNWPVSLMATFAIACTFSLGACSNDERTADEIEMPQTEVVSNNVEANEAYADEFTTESETAAATTPAANWNTRRSASSVNINKLLNEYPEVNQAIRTSLATVIENPGTNEDYMNRENEMY